MDLCSDDSSSSSSDESDISSSPLTPSPFLSPFLPSSPAIPISSSPIPSIPISFGSSPSSPSLSLEPRDLVYSSTSTSPTSTMPSLVTSLTTLPRAFLRKTNRVEIMLEVCPFPSLSELWCTSTNIRLKPDQPGYSTSLQMSPCGSYLLARHVFCFSLIYFQITKKLLDGI